MLLNYRFRPSKTVRKMIPIIVIHGLFGSLSNLGTLAEFLSKHQDIIQIDLRNHGKSPHDPIMNYEVMTQDIITLLNHLAIQKCIVIGHSIGGKIAMMLGILAKKLIEKIIVIDIAPKKYDAQKFHNLFSIINYINESKIKNKNQIIDIMQKNYIKPNLIEFLLKSFQQGKWIFNFNAIVKNYENINNWEKHQICKKSILFIKGELSSYIENTYIKKIYDQFPYAYIQTVPKAGHWTHYDNPKYVFNIIEQFVSNKFI